MRIVDDAAIRRHATVRFRSEYDYAVFEYWRSAKVMAYLQRAGIGRFDRVLDDGCGGGGMCVSFAEEARTVVGIEPGERFRDVGQRLAAEKGVRNVRFAQADGTRLPFRSGSFDLVLSHSVIEHVADPLSYLKEARRVLAPGGAMLLNTAPYLSSSGSHLPRYKLPVPVHLMAGRKAAFALACWVGRHRPTWFDIGSQSSSYVTAGQRGERKIDDLLYRVTLSNLRANIEAAGLQPRREDLAVSRFVTRTLGPSAARLTPHVPLLRDIFVTNTQYILVASSEVR
jgi:2-polyprenyl-3-methyl-5-hydroxy-6-metoxy-1,4-benzoquinol methylase